MSLLFSILYYPYISGYQTESTTFITFSDDNFGIYNSIDYHI